MGKLTRTILALAALTASASATQVEEWRTFTGTDSNGVKFVSVKAQKFEFSMEFRCDEHDWQDHRLWVKFLGPSLPRLYGEADATARLSLLFTRHGGVLYREAWDAYFENEGPDQPGWQGSINAGKSELEALASAHKIEILDSEALSIYSFSAKGTAAGAGAIRKHCRLGAD